MNERLDAEPEAHVLYRGTYDQPRERVLAGVPSVLPPMAESSPRNRLGLAHWLVNEDNPLTSRVTVNRYWQMHFGRGLVDSVDDFGLRGSLPTHPGLLDWLAGQLIEGGWSLKRAHRSMMLSATYQMSTLTDPVGETQCSPLPWIVRKHPDRVLLLVTRRHRYTRIFVVFIVGRQSPGTARP